MIPKGSTLSVHSFVDLASIPLYARAGPSLEVHCADVETTRWLKSRFLNSLWLEDVLEDEAKLPLIQCPLALLVNVDAPKTTVLYGGSSNVSDLLIYGVLSTIFPAAARPPSPPDSSSAAAAQNQPSSRTTVELRIYAAPLSGSYVQRVQSLPSPPSSPSDDAVAQTYGQNDAHFFPDLRSPSPRRKRTLSIFEGAAQHHRQVRKRGGEAVSQLMAGPRSSSQSQSHHTITIKREPEDDSDRLGFRSRSASMGPASMRGRLGDGQMGQKSESQQQSSFMSQLHRSAKQRESVAPDRARSKSVVPGTPLPSHVPSGDTQETEPAGSPPRDAATILSQNKALITRTILTCMRLYGYHRKSSHHSTRETPALKQDPDGPHDETDIQITDAQEHNHQPSSVGNEDEFRAMYHATYKAANFALRKYLKNDPSTILPPVLTRETATNVVDGILKLFCEEH